MIAQNGARAVDMNNIPIDTDTVDVSASWAYALLCCFQLP